MHGIWKDMFYVALPIAEKILRPIFVYVFLIVSLRLSGKRELVQLNPFPPGGIANVVEYRAERNYWR